MLRIDTLGKCRRRSALYARTPEKGASRKPINRQLHKTRFAEAGGVALGYLDTRYRPQHLVGVHKNPPPRESGYDACTRPTTPWLLSPSRWAKSLRPGMVGRFA